MVFTSLQFFIFLPLLFLIHHYSGERTRRLLLLLASLVFYAAFKLPHLLLALAVVVGSTYFVGLKIGGSASPPAKKRWFLAGLGINLLVLVSIKYLPVLIRNITSLAADMSWDLPLPTVPLLVSIGVSYFVFQALSYLIDLYLEIIEPERDVVLFALSLSFFPKLLQGPIERSGDLLPQLRAPYVFRYEVVRSGLLLFAWGMFKKLVVADRLGLYVNMVYGSIPAHTGPAFLCATWLYAFQLYFDFSGYTDMALGSARIFNINLTQNFNTPYLATSIADFWRRWHISFSRWILDYIFKPLQMTFRNRGTAGTAFALFLTFLVSGVWHGASWGFVIWGVLHGLYLAASVFYKPYQKRLHKTLGLQGTRTLKIWQMLVTFNLVCIAWVFFRADTLSDAWYIITHTVTDIGSALARGDFAALKQLGPGRSRFYQSFLPMSATLMVFLLKDRIDFFNRPRWFRWSAYYLLVYLTLYHSVITDKQQFVYFQF
jgi:D-alanyl-lipoteichoic acid acyltransferase DltB (MBOAT superfamily)